MHAAASALSEMMIALEIAIDGGKDSLSMAARAKNEKTGENELVKAPGTTAAALQLLFLSVLVCQAPLSSHATYHALTSHKLSRPVRGIVMRQVV